MPPFGHRDARYSGYPVQPAPPARAVRGISRGPGRNEPRPVQASSGIRLYESTVIKYLSMAGGDPEQAGGVGRFMLATAAPGVSAPPGWLPSKINPPAPGPPWVPRRVNVPWKLVLLP